MRSAVVTGGTDGIGHAVAAGLAAAGHRVLIVGRDPVKGARAEQEISAATGNAEVAFLGADLSLVREAHRLAAEVAARVDSLHYLVHSAGLVRARRVVSVEGVESMFAVNYLTRFALTARLLPLLAAGGRPGAAARIVLVGGAVRRGRVRSDDVNLTSGFHAVRAVRQSQHANSVPTVELARRLSDAAVPVTVTCLGPGMVATGIRQGFPRWMRAAATLAGPLALPPQRVAESVLRLLHDSAWEGVSGEHFFHIRTFRQVTVPAARDAQDGRRLWALSEWLTARAERQAKRQAAP